MNTKCFFCGKIAVYWHSIRRVVMCHHCGIEYYTPEEWR